MVVPYLYSDLDCTDYSDFDLYSVLALEVVPVRIAVVVAVVVAFVLIVVQIVVATVSAVVAVVLVVVLIVDEPVVVVVAAAVVVANQHDYQDVVMVVDLVALELNYHPVVDSNSFDIVVVVVVEVVLVDHPSSDLH